MKKRTNSDEIQGIAKLSFCNTNAMIEVSGEWKILNNRTCSHDIIEEISKSRTVCKIDTVIVTCHDLKCWDSSLVAFLKKISDFCSEKKIKCDVNDVPDGVQRLLQLSVSHVTSTKNDSTVTQRTCVVGSIFSYIKNVFQSCGDIFLAICKFSIGKAKIRNREFLPIVQEVGIEALPIVSLISFLVGVIISFISVLQLEKLGASIYIADLIGITMLREMGCIMAGIIMAGRTGASFAATIGTMVTNDEIDALHTTGISSVEFLMLPRIFALTLMMPVLCIYSDFIGIFGGMIAAIASSNITAKQFYSQLLNAAHVNDVLIGVVKSSVFGILVSSIGCVKGIQCRHSAEGVGMATTSAVVDSITAIIIADAIFAVIFAAIGI